LPTRKKTGMSLIRTVEEGRATALVAELHADKMYLWHALECSKGLVLNSKVAIVWQEVSGAMGRSMATRSHELVNFAATAHPLLGGSPYAV